MECKKVEELLPDYAEGLLPEGDRSEVKKHIAGCSRCAQELEDLNGYFQALKDLDTVDAPPEFLGNIHKRLENKSFFQKLLLGLLGTGGRKIPLEYAGISLTAILIMAIYIAVFNPLEREIKKFQETSEQGEVEQEQYAYDRKEGPEQPAEEGEKKQAETHVEINASDPETGTGKKLKVSAPAKRLKTKSSKAKSISRPEPEVTALSSTAGKDAAASGDARTTQGAGARPEPREKQAAPPTTEARKQTAEKAAPRQKRMAEPSVPGEAAERETDEQPSEMMMSAGTADASEKALEPLAVVKSPENKALRIEIAMTLYPTDDVDEDQASKPKSGLKDAADLEQTGPQGKARKRKGPAPTAKLSARSAKRPPTTPLEHMKFKIKQNGGRIVSERVEDEIKILEVSIAAEKYNGLINGIKRLGRFKNLPPQPPQKSAGPVIINFKIQ
ncbi:zf-HC2 domain-containing protein [Fibrobacterota bacterium]